MPEPLPETTLAWLHHSAAVHGSAYSQVLLNLMERVEALEAAQPTPPPAPAGGLVERVALAIGGEGDHPANWTPEAQAAIREVAAWMRENETGFNAARWLEQEADR